jgi:dolichol-phosphate hexosyltransferase
MSYRKQVVTVVIPCYNEAASIGKVIRDFHKSELNKAIFDFDILVVDNNSQDNTASVAEKAGARVLKEYRQGKGYAMQTGFANILPEARYVVMLDGDDTYLPEEALRLLEPLHHNFCDVVVGSRLGGKMDHGSMPLLNRAGNWGFTHLARLVYKVNVTDVFSGYYAWKRSALDRLVPHLHSHGFALEMEMLTKMARMKYNVYSVPITFNQRSGTPNLRPILDGMRVLKMFIANLWWYKPVGSPLENEEIQGQAEAE